MITYAIEPWEMYCQGMEGMWERHWLELAKDQEVIKLNVDHARYEAAQAAGQLFIAVGRAEGVVVAYWIGIINTHLHYKDVLHCFNDIYFVEKEFRKGGAGTILFQFVESQLKKRGVKKITNACKLSHDHGPLFESLGFSAIETTYTKLIGD